MAQRPGRVIYETHGHIYNYEMGALAAIAAASSR
jgi:threonine aldolase